MRARNLLILVCLLTELVLPAALCSQARPDSAADWIAIDPEYILYVDVPAGRIVIALSKKLAQNHVSQMKILAREHYFDGLPFHRVIGGFVAQAGDMAKEPRDLGSAAKSLEPRFDEPWSEDLHFVPLGAPDEYQEQTGFIDGFPAMRSLSENRVWLTGCPGMVGMPRDDDPKSAAAGFAIALGSNRYNDRNGTRFGRVVDGLDIARMMRRANVDDPSTWTLIDSVRVAAARASDAARDPQYECGRLPRLPCISTDSGQSVVCDEDHKIGRMHDVDRAYQNSSGRRIDCRAELAIGMVTIAPSTVWFSLISDEVSVFGQASLAAKAYSPRSSRRGHRDVHFRDGLFLGTFRVRIHLYDSPAKRQIRVDQGSANLFEIR